LEDLVAGVVLSEKTVAADGAVSETITNPTADQVIVLHVKHTGATTVPIVYGGTLEFPLRAQV